ncbi:MAG: hypothetical protein HOH04_13510 [Rhodospirillaceae bacterium]|nr:hypothetical protein [Rhodospirillaceae bacterium]
MKRLFAVFLLITIAGISPARAAPQILGVIAYNDPVPMSCATGQCWAELVTVCLQKQRPNPLAGTAYRFHGEGSADLIVSDVTGKQTRLPAADYVKIKVARGFTSVRVELTERQMRELGAAKVAITVGKGMSLVPIEVAGDPDPITKDELAYVRDFLRPEADRWLEANDGRAQATRLVNRMINISPRVGRMSGTDRASLMARAVESSSDTFSTKGQARAEANFQACRYMVEDIGRYFSMRRCLETKHDNMMLDVNTRPTAKVRY